MLDIVYKGESYKLVVNKDLFNCIKVLFVGYMFMNNKQYKKCMNYERHIYLVEV